MRFDWAEPSTFAPALDGVRAVYLVPPPAELEPMRFAAPFFAAARAAGVRRVVLLGSLIVLPDAPGVAELVAAVRSMPEPVVLRPSGFMQNLLGDHPLAVGCGSAASWSARPGTASSAGSTPRTSPRWRPGRSPIPRCPASTC
ncbi:hypothetical protein [Saccharopolyspora gregorii]|uniref:NmrA-like domain-containing protein n=1 Tax=Saccharopolyspora gregorii TaxID=33914 RepID=A0ABP6RG73_9PSEU